MSNALAIAHVTQALALLIEANLQPEIDMAVKVETRKPPADPPAEPTITVFLYQTTPNTSQRNNDLATRAPDGKLLKRPAAALDLNFVISAYGEETELVGQRLIGSVVRTLHEIPVLPRDIIEQAGERPYLVGSDLADAEQRVRFVPTVMDIDETSKLWGMLNQTPYTLSVTYQAALVLIEGRGTPLPARPVERSTVQVLPFGAPGAPVPPGPAADAGPSGDDADRAPEKAGAEPGTEPGTEARTEAATKSGPRTKAVTKAVAKKSTKAAAKAPARARRSTAGTTRRTAPDAPATTRGGAEGEGR
ncbi:MULTISPECIES: DUF4255 domain-containing protein [unclassified Streptomyces]|uniref:DUF4255 domain-containing protein n=1 Tax=unclassified Streptomyces TaxID=2593676 RepID=UPI0035E08FE9